MLARQDAGEVAARTRRPAWSSSAVVTLSSLVAAVVVVRHLGTKPLWLDEAVSVSGACGW